MGGLALSSFPGGPTPPECAYKGPLGAQNKGIKWQGTSNSEMTLRTLHSEAVLEHKHSPLS